MGRTRQMYRGFTLIELLVVVAIISVLVAILLPAMSQARANATRLRCMNNHREVLTALRQYTEDFEYFPPVGNSGYNYWGGQGWYWVQPWHSILSDNKYLINHAMAFCPSLANPDGCTYTGLGLRFDQPWPPGSRTAIAWDNPNAAAPVSAFDSCASRKVITADSSRGGSAYSFVIQSPGEITERHGAFAPVGYLDGHVGTYDFAYSVSSLSPAAGDVWWGDGQ